MVVEALRAGGRAARRARAAARRGRRRRRARAPTRASHTIAFTGSRPGRPRDPAHAPPTCRAGQRHLKRVVAEMGGKNCVIVDADADLDDAVPGDRASRRSSTPARSARPPRACSSHEAIADALIERLAGAVEVLQVGQADAFGTDVPPVIEREAQERVERYARARRASGRDRRRRATASRRRGWFCAPTRRRPTCRRTRRCCARRSNYHKHPTTGSAPPSRTSARARPARRSSGRCSPSSASATSTTPATASTACPSRSPAGCSAATRTPSSASSRRTPVGNLYVNRADHRRDGRRASRSAATASRHRHAGRRPGLPAAADRDGVRRSSTENHERPSPDRGDIVRAVAPVAHARVNVLVHASGAARDVQPPQVTAARSRTLARPAGTTTDRPAVRGRCSREAACSAAATSSGERPTDCAGRHRRRRLRQPDAGRRARVARDVRTHVRRGSARAAGVSPLSSGWKLTDEHRALRGGDRVAVDLGEDLDVRRRARRSTARG